MRGTKLGQHRKKKEKSSEQKVKIFYGLTCRRIRYRLYDPKSVKK